MDFEWTQHARLTIAKRGIPEEWIQRALHQPDWREPDALDPSLEHRLIRIQEAEERVLRVIVNNTTQPIRLVTAFLDRRRRQI
ncbi:MAG: DUF4258 domain-containing protein [Candidatus Delongbacteria bacterium]